MKLLAIIALAFALTGCISAEDEARGRVVSEEVCGKYNAKPLITYIGGLDRKVTVKCLNTSTGITFMVATEIEI